MEREYSRRDVLKGAAVMAGAFLVPSAAEGVRRKVESEQSEPTELTYEQAMTDAFRFKDLLNQIPEEQRIGITSEEDLVYWTAEIMPYFEYEGIVEDTEPNRMNGMVYPPVMSFNDYQDGIRSHHVLGTTNIFSNEVDLNARMINPVSPWYGREDSIGTLVHELAHVQGIKFPSPGSDIDHEASAQLVTLEVLAAMVNHGNEKALPALLDELGHMNMQAAHFLAIRDGRKDDFDRDRARLLNPVALANSEKADRQWAGYEDEERFPYILDAYNYRPMNELYQGFRNEDRIYGVKLPKNWLHDLITGPDYYAGDFSLSENTTPAVPEHIIYPEGPIPLHVDDLHYFYDNAEAMVNDFVK